MKIAAFDIGSTSVKHALYEKKQLTQKGAFATPQAFVGLQAQMQQTISGYALMLLVLASERQEQLI